LRDGADLQPDVMLEMMARQVGITLGVTNASSFKVVSVGTPSFSVDDHTQWT
jgi:hypothetical protein